MWQGIRTVTDLSLRQFEWKFRFTMNPDFREYLIEHNAGSPTFGAFPTMDRNRTLSRFLDFEDRCSPDGAWVLNQRLRKYIGASRIAIGVDPVGNFICLERHERQQYIALWNHLTGDYERCLLDIPAFLRTIG